MTVKVLRAASLAMVQDIYYDVLSKPSFDRSVKNDREFALELLGAFRKGINLDDDLQRHAEMIARTRFSKAA